MKFSLRAANYTVTPASSQIVFGGVSNFDIRGLMYVGNATAKVDIYVAGDPNLPFASVSGTTVTFATPMTAMSASDVYIVIYDDPQIVQPVSGTVSATQSGTWTANALGGQYNSTLPTLANGANAYLAVDVNGRVLLSPTSVLNVYPVGTYNSTAPSLTNGGQTATQVSPNGSMFVDLSRSSVIGSATGGTAATASLLGGGVYSATAPTLTNGQQVGLQTDVNGNLKVTAVGGGTSSGSITAAGTNGTQAQAVQGIVGGVALPVIQAATAAANAVLESRVASAASTNATSLKTSAGNLVGIEVYNLATSVRYLKVYNKASAPTVGTDTPTWTIPLPAGGGFSWEPPIPRTFATGLAYAITGAVADSDTTAVAANDVVGVIRYL